MLRDTILSASLAPRMTCTPSAHATRVSPSTSSTRFTTCGCSSLSTSITCFAIDACFAVANGTRTVLTALGKTEHQVGILRVLTLCATVNRRCRSWRFRKKVIDESRVGRVRFASCLHLCSSCMIYSTARYAAYKLQGGLHARLRREIADTVLL